MCRGIWWWPSNATPWEKPGMRCRGYRDSTAGTVGESVTISNKVGRSSSVKIFQPTGRAFAL